jgi:pimeloyl-ACP methyl ester carboxylesterase
MEAWFPNGLEKQIIAGAGHFVHREQPDRVNRLILEFIRP